MCGAGLSIRGSYGKGVGDGEGKEDGHGPLKWLLDELASMLSAHLRRLDSQREQNKQRVAQNIILVVNYPATRDVLGYLARRAHAVGNDARR